MKPLYIVTFFALALLIVNAYQAIRYQSLQKSIRLLREEQHVILTENRRILAAIALLRSPDAIQERSRSELNFDLLDQARNVYIELKK